MTHPGFSNYYRVHGLGLEVTSNQPQVMEIVHFRLQQFAAPGRGFIDLTLEFCAVSRVGEHSVERPEGRGRPVYEPPVGEVLYFDAEDRLFLHLGDQVRGEVVPREGRIRVSYLRKNVENLWLAAHPLLTLCLIELLKRRGRYSLHAAGLRINGQGVLLAGSSGAGKSTLALTLLRTGCGFLGDDLLFLQPGRNGLTVLAFPDELDLTKETAGFFPELELLLRLPKPPGRPKHAVHVEEIYEVEFVRECAPGVLVFPQVASTAKSVIQPLSPEAALLELVPNVLLTEARSSQTHLDALADLVRESTCYRLETGRDFEALPSLFRSLVE